MKIAVAAMGNTVSGHFGHCDNFNLYDADGGVITAEESTPNPGHRPGFLPNFLADKGYDPQYGARPLARSIQKYLEDPLAELMLERNAAKQSGTDIEVDYHDGDEKLTLTAKEM